MERSLEGPTTYSMFQRWFDDVNSVTEDITWSFRTPPLPLLVDQDLHFGMTMGSVKTMISLVWTLQKIV